MEREITFSHLFLLPYVFFFLSFAPSLRKIGICFNFSNFFEGQTEFFLFPFFKRKGGVFLFSLSFEEKKAKKKTIKDLLKLIFLFSFLKKKKVYFFSHYFREEENEKERNKNLCEYSSAKEGANLCGLRFSPQFSFF